MKVRVKPKVAIINANIFSNSPVFLETRVFRQDCSALFPFEHGGRTETGKQTDLSRRFPSRRHVLGVK